MNKKDCEHLGYLLSMHNPVNWDLCVAIFTMDDRIEPEYELFQEAQGESDEIIDLTEDLMLKYNGRIIFSPSLPHSEKHTRSVWTKQEEQFLVAITIRAYLDEEPKPL